MSADLIFEEPPPLKGGGGRGQSAVGMWLDQLRDHPGRWAKFDRPIAATIAVKIRHGRGYGVAKGEFEARTRAISGTGKVDLFARYVGGES